MPPTPPTAENLTAHEKGPGASPAPPPTCRPPLPATCPPAPSWWPWWGGSADFGDDFARFDLVAGWRRTELPARRARPTVPPATTPGPGAATHRRGKAARVSGCQETGTFRTFAPHPGGAAGGTPVPATGEGARRLDSLPTGGVRQRHVLQSGGGMRSRCRRWSRLGVRSSLDANRRTFDHLDGRALRELQGSRVLALEQAPRGHHEEPKPTQCQAEQAEAERPLLARGRPRLQSARSPS